MKRTAIYILLGVLAISTVGCRKNNTGEENDSAKIEILLEEKLADNESDEELSVNTDNSVPIVNNGGEVIKIGDDFYYKEGKKIYSDGKMLYAATTEADGTDYIYQYDLDGNNAIKLIQGTWVGISDDQKALYFLCKKENGVKSFNVFSPDFMDVHQVYEADNAEFLTVESGFVYICRAESDGLYLDRIEISDGNCEENLLGMPLQTEEITCFYAGDGYMIFAAGKYEGSAGFFYGDFYSYNLENKKLKQLHMTDSDEFYVFDGAVYYQKYFDDEEAANGLYRTNYDFSEDELIADDLTILMIDEEDGTILTSKNGQLLRVSVDGTEQTVLLDMGKDAGWTWEEYDNIRFTEINNVEDLIFLKAERWGYIEGNGWRNSLIAEEYFKVHANGNGFSVWNPTAF